MKLAKYCCLIPIVAMVFGASGSQQLSAQAARPAPAIWTADPALSSDPNQSHQSRLRPRAATRVSRLRGTSPAPSVVQQGLHR